MSEKKEKMTVVLSFELCYDDKATRDAAVKAIGDDNITTEDSGLKEKGYTIHDGIEIEAEQIYDIFFEIYKYVIYCSADRAYVWYFSPDYNNVAGVARTTQIGMIDHEVGVIPELDFAPKYIEEAKNIGCYEFTVLGCEEEKKTAIEFVDAWMFEDEISTLFWRMISQEYHEHNFTDEEMNALTDALPDEFSGAYFAG